MTDDNSKPNPNPQEIRIDNKIPTKPITEGVNKEAIKTKNTIPTKPMTFNDLPKKNK